MPVRVELSHDGDDGVPQFAGSQSQLADGADACISIGLINNMPEAAFEATERQFISLLDAASEGIDISLSLYVLPAAKVGGGRVGDLYSSIDVLRGQWLDGLIVTGREPTTPDLKGEPYWQSFTELVGWARDNTYSTVWSCLAAHAAILHMDGIGRRRSVDKRFGVFECASTSSHRLVAKAGPRFHMPHSRWNGVAEEDLLAGGYRVLTRTAEAEVDAFIKQENSLFVFFQGHPEYESDTLLREYRRDVGRYLRSQTSTYPSTPLHYFDTDTESALADLRARARDSRSSKEIVAAVAKVLDGKKIENTWHSTAVQLYRNWLEYISENKEARRDGRTIRSSSNAIADEPKLLTLP